MGEPPELFKAQLFALSGVQPDRQKVMVKGNVIKVTTPLKLSTRLVLVFRLTLVFGMCKIEMHTMIYIIYYVKMPVSMGV